MGKKEKDSLVLVFTESSFEEHESYTMVIFGNVG